MPRFAITQFRKWLSSPEGGGLSKSTTANYTSMVRGFFVDQARARQLLADPKGLERAALAHDHGLLSNSRGMFRSSLRAFLRFFAAATKATPLEIDFLDFRTRDPLGGIKGWEKHPISDLLHAIIYDSKVKPGHLEMARWGDVEKAGGIARIYVNQFHVVYSVPLDVARKLSLWAGNGTPSPKDKPVVPVEPGSSSAMPAKRMVRIAGSRVLEPATS